MIVTENNINDIIGKTPIITDDLTVNGQINCEKVNASQEIKSNGEITSANAVFDTLYVENKVGDVETNPTLAVGMNNVIIGREAIGALPEKNVEVDIKGTINYNGEKLEDMIDACVAAGGALPNDIHCNSITCKNVLGENDNLTVGNFVQGKTTIYGGEGIEANSVSLDLRTLTIYVNKGMHIFAPRYGEDPKDITNPLLYREIATRSDIVYDETNNFECVKEHMESIRNAG